jgi:hypothetical protein
MGRRLSNPAQLGQPPSGSLDQKVEPREANPDTLSANPSHKASSTGKGRQTGAVKAIVNWLESSALRNRPSELRKNQQQAAAQSRPSDLGVGYDTISSSKPARAGVSTEFAEDYSLTLLKFKSYFNNRPLARCLDEPEPESTHSSTTVRLISAKPQLQQDKPAGGDENLIKKAYPGMVRGPAEAVSF